MWEGRKVHIGFVGAVAQDGTSMGLMGVRFGIETHCVDRGQAREHGGSDLSPFTFNLLPREACHPPIAIIFLPGW